MEFEGVQDGIAVGVDVQQEELWVALYDHADDDVVYLRQVSCSMEWDYIDLGEVFRLFFFFGTPDAAIDFGACGFEFACPRRDHL